MNAGSRRGTPLWVSIEGVNGVGKTSAARATAAVLGTRGCLLDEVTDQEHGTLPGAVIAALSRGGDPFLRSGHPVVETLALLALQVRKTELLAQAARPSVQVIIEDRGPDSVAVYQAAILCPQSALTPRADVARRILSDARRWRGLPDVTLLLVGDPTVCAHRFGERLGWQLRPADVRLIEQIDRLYCVLAADDPNRYAVIDVSGLTLRESGAAMAEAVTGLLERLSAHA